MKIENMPGQTFSTNFQLQTSSVIMSIKKRKKKLVFQYFPPTKKEIRVVQNDYIDKTFPHPSMWTFLLHHGTKRRLKVAIFDGQLPEVTH